jgi:XRE family transcriptional regulator, regulator of sulfur utilization
MVGLLAVSNRPNHRKILGEALRSERKAAGLSQEKLAEKSDLHPNYIGEVERGEKNISVDALVQIARALKVSLTKLLPGL